MSGGWEGTEGVTREVVMAGGRVPLREVIGLNVEVAHLRRTRHTTAASTAS